MQLIFTVDELAAALRLSPRRFYELKPQLEAAGFPRPVPGLGARWSVAAVMAYVNGSSDVAAALPAAPAGAGGEGAETPPAPVIDMRRRLENRYGGVRR